MPPLPLRRRSPRSLILGRERASLLARRLGSTLRERRLAAGLGQRELGARAGISQTEVSRLERGRAAGTGLDVWAACAAALDVQLAAFIEAMPGADLPRDIQHLRGQNLVVARAAPGGWRALPEADLDPGRWSRSIDVLLSRAARREAAVVEIWDLLLDGGEALRGLTAKVRALQTRLGPEWQVRGLMVVRGTHRNRRLVRELGSLFAARFPAPSRDWLRALSDPARQMPSADGFVWTTVTGDDLLPARLAP